LNLASKSTANARKQEQTLTGYPFKIWVLFWGLLWGLGFRLSYVNTITWQGIIFNLSAGMIAIITAIAK